MTNFGRLEGFACILHPVNPCCEVSLYNIRYDKLTVYKVSYYSTPPPPYYVLYCFTISSKFKNTRQTTLKAGILFFKRIRGYHK